METNERPAYQQRMHDEHAELIGRLRKLNDFLTSEKSNTVEMKELGRMRRQAMAMSIYAEVLSERMENFKTQKA